MGFGLMRGGLYNSRRDGIHSHAVFGMSPRLSSRREARLTPFRIGRNWAGPKAAMYLTASSCFDAMRIRISRVWSVGCASTASGQVAATLPISVTNSRRLSFSFAPLLVRVDFSDITARELRHRRSATNDAIRLN